ncbi:MAG: hypothetical protein HPY66_2616 [Firmicutes bacterium]|nr:hypothetical protein [Bacillota bacterium]MDI6704996.1 DUF5711 family protein [Bacillota bacterium]
MRKKRYRKDNKTKYLIALTLLTVIITYFAYPHFYSKFVSVKLIPGDYFDISYQDGEDVYADFDTISGKLVHLQGDTVRLIDGEGNTVWSRTVNAKNPFLSASADTIAICDRETNKVYGLNEQGELIWEFTSAGKVERMGFDNSNLWVKSTKQEQAVVEVLNGNGEGSSYLAAGKTEVTGVTVSKDGKNIAVATADIKGGRLSCNVVLYKNDGSIIWAKDLTEDMVFGLKITDTGNIMVLSEKSLISYDIKGSILWQKPLKGYVSAKLLSSSGTSIVSLAEDYRMGIPGKIGEETFIYNDKGEILRTIAWKDRIDGISEGEGYAVLFSGRKIKLVSMLSGDIVDTDLDMDIGRLLLLTDNKLACISGNRIYFSDIKR